VITKLRIALRLKALASRWREALRGFRVKSMVKILDFSLGVLLKGAREERERGELEYVVEAIIDRVGTDETAFKRALRRDLLAITRNPKKLRKLERAAVGMLRERGQRND